MKRISKEEFNQLKLKKMNEKEYYAAILKSVIEINKDEIDAGFRINANDLYNNISSSIETKEDLFLYICNETGNHSIYSDGKIEYTALKPGERFMYIKEIDSKQYLLSSIYLDTQDNLIIKFDNMDDIRKHNLYTMYPKIKEVKQFNITDIKSAYYKTTF